MSIDSRIIDTVKDALVQKVVDCFFDSGDFNGLSAQSLPGDLKELIEPLVAEGRIYINFGQRMANPFIIGFDQEDAETNLVVLKKAGTVDRGVLYPTARVLAEVDAQDHFPNAPYSAELALGRGQLEPRFFTPDVLSRYRDDPRYDYTFDIDGEIRGVGVAEDSYLKTMSVGLTKDESTDEIAVGVPLRYLHDLSAVEQGYWQSHEHANPGQFGLHPDFVRPHLLGEFPERHSPFEAMLWEMEIVNELCEAIGFPKLYRETFRREKRPTDFSYVVRPTKKELNVFIEQLNKMLIDNMDAKFFRGQVDILAEQTDPNGTVYMAPRGTLSMLNDWMEMIAKVDPDGLVPSATKALRDIRKKRSSVAHAIKDNEYDMAIFTQQRRLIIEGYLAVRTIRQLLQSHSKAKMVIVPEDLEEAKVWNF